MEALNKRIAQAISWSAVDVLFRQGSQFLIAVLLARLLAPEDFGLIAILYIFTAIGNLFIDSGFSSALIQRQDVSHTDESTVFYFNLAMAALMSLLLGSIASLIVEFFGQPILRPLTYIMALSQFIGAFGSIHSVLLTKNLMFKTIMKAGVISSLLSGGMALLFALYGYGVWSLAWQTLAASLINVLSLWSLHHWRPKFVFSLDSLRKLFRFGGFLFISGFLDVLYTRMYALLIGKLFSVTDLGFYSRALNTRQMPSSVLETVFNRVAFPVFSRAAIDKNLLVKGVKKALVVMMIINIPVMLSLAVVAEPFTIVLFGEKWLPSAPILQVLCLAGLLWPLHTVNLNALMAQGHSDLFLRIEVIKKVICLGVIVFACFYGVMAIAWAQVFTGFIAFFINSYYTGKLLGYGAMQQLYDISPFLGIGFLMAALNWWGMNNTQLSPLPALMGIVSVGVVFYVGVSWAFIKASGWRKVFLELG